MYNCKNVCLEAGITLVFIYFIARHHHQSPQKDSLTRKFYLEGESGGGEEGGGEGAVV